MAGMQYNNPAGGTNSSIGTNPQQFFLIKQALIDARKEQYFTQLADAVSMPKNFGKKIKRFHYIPLLDDRNANDQGLDASGAVIANGNLYGSSKDVGTIQGKLPLLSENGGRVNRVGFKRVEIEGTFAKFGFFDEYTQASLDFDNDADLEMHINREMINGASQITEAQLQIDLLSAAGTVRYAGAATSKATVAGTVVSYSDLMHLSIDLDNVRTPKQTTAFTGTRMIDTVTIPGARALYIGSDLLPTIRAMKDLFNNPAFIPVQRYAAGGPVLAEMSTKYGSGHLIGEVGTIDQFRIIVVPEMMKWAGAGADATGDATCHATGNKYDVYPMLSVGEQSFTTISFQTDGKDVKFKIIHKRPGEDNTNQLDPYGESGFMSIKWFYGFMALRPERIGLLYTAAKL